MLTQKQVITSECDICRDETIYEEEIPVNGCALIPSPPKGWWSIGHIVVCPKHTAIIIHGKVGGSLRIEDNS